VARTIEAMWNIPPYMTLAHPSHDYTSQLAWHAPWHRQPCLRQEAALSFTSIRGEELLVTSRNHAERAIQMPDFPSLQGFEARLRSPH